jgi:phosphate starvation-inducible PhoH-like protein
MSINTTSNRKDKKRKATETNTIVDCNGIDTELSANFSYNFKIKKPFYFNTAHKEFYDSIKNENSNMAFVDGPAGSAKSYIAVLAALELFKEKKIKNIIYIRSVIESASRSIGALPGEIDDKFLPYAMPLIEKVKEITDDATCLQLKAANVISAIPVNFCRGLTFNDSVVIVDEIQNMTIEEATTILTRFGKNSKYVICGDSKQSDIGKLSCISKLFAAFDTTESVLNNIVVHHFGESEIVRSKILKFITKVIETIPRGISK